MTHVFYLTEYNWERGELVRECKKNLVIRENIISSVGHLTTREIRVAKEKCARPGESVCVVWERWRGVNGRGGYRVEREMYPELRVPAEQVRRQPGGPGRISEESRGVTSSNPHWPWICK
jgi:hypothetical protein